MVGAHKLRKVYIKIKNKAGMERGVASHPFLKFEKESLFFGETTGGACRWFQKKVHSEWQGGRNNMTKS